MANQKYVYSVAKHVISKIGGVDGHGAGIQAEYNQVSLAEVLWSMYGKKIIFAMKDFKPKSLGDVSAGAGIERFPFYNWDREMLDYGPSHENSGLKTLRLLAAYVVASAILDIVESDIKDDEQNDLLEQEVDAMSSCPGRQRWTQIGNGMPPEEGEGF